MTSMCSRLVGGATKVALLAALLFSIPTGLSTTRLAAQGDANQIVPRAAYKELKWRNVGPTRAGRVTAYAGVRQQPNVFYMGPTGGGVWKSEDYGITWKPISDGQISTGSIGWIEVAPSDPNQVWVGTGSAAIRSNVIIGRGVYKSNDAGKTWQFMGLREAGQIGSVHVHPTNPNIVWLAALGSPFGPTDERGVFKTTDGGKTWKKTLFVNNETGARDLEVDPQDPNVLYAAMYRGFRKGWEIISGGPAAQGGIYKSTDGGETWTKLSAGLPAKLIGKIDIDIARSNPRVLYAMIEAPDAEGGLYTSKDAGATWQLVNSAARLRARPFYFHYVNVNPKDENEVWVNELSLHKSTDGGKNFTAVETPHGDNHGMWFNPDNPSIILQVNDGGANVSLNGGESWSSILNQPTAEVYMVSVDDQYPYRLYFPQQDNTTMSVPSVPGVSWGLDHPAEAWVQLSGCETGQVWARKDGKTIWGACKGEVGRYNVGTGQEKHYWVYPQNRYGQRPDDIKYRFPRQTVVYISPHDEKVVYQASHVLHRSVDEGVTWETISPDLTANEPDKQIVPGSPITRDVTGEEVYSSIYAMVESRLEKGVIWVGANDGPVSVTRDNGKTWKNVTPKGLAPGGRVQTIEDSPHAKGSAYVAIYRMMREHDLKPYIYKTTDYGESWTLLTDGKNGIPIDHPTRVIREDPARKGLLYVGSEFGFFVSFNDGKNWQTLQQNLPATPVTDIRVQRNDLVISTMGRSLWIMDNVTPLQQLAAISSGTPTANANVNSNSNSNVRRAEASASADAVPGSAGAEAPALRTVDTDVVAQTASGRGSMPAVTLFQPRDAIRYRYPATPTSGSEPEYPAPSAQFDMWFESAPTGDAKLDVVDAKGQIVKSWGIVQPRSGSGGQEMRGPFRRGSGSDGIKPEAGMQRFSWDMRHPGPWSPNAPNGGPGGPIAAPGKYTVRLTSNGQTQTKSFELKADPRVLGDGVTNADLDEQVSFQLKVRDAMSDARRLQQQVEQAMQKAGVKPPPSAPPGVRPMDMKFDHPLQKIWATLVDMPGTYQQPMLQNQLQNIARMIGQADQKIGKDAIDRFNDLMKELKAAQADLAKIAGSTD